MISYNELKKIYDQMSSVSNYDEALAANNAALGIFNQPKSNKNDPWIPAPTNNNNVSVTIDPPPTVRAPNILEFLFPPLALLNIGLAGGGLPTADTLPDVTIEGTPDAVTEILDSNPIVTYQTPPATADPLSGLGSTVDLIVKFLPIILVVGLFTSIKKVF